MSLFLQTQELCQKYNIRPARSKGQNFLIDEEAYDAMTEVADLKKNDVVLEVGPGLGFLTERLAHRTQKVFAVELDDKVTSVLKKRLQTEKISNVTIYNEDILNFTNSWAEDVGVVKDKLKVVANLPYNITSFFLRKFISGNEADIKPTSLTLMLQKEVGERLAASAGDMSLLAISVQVYAAVTLHDYVPPQSFFPSPKVGSIIVSIQRTDHYLKQLEALEITEKIFFRLVKIGFSARRKMLHANLRAGLRISKEVILTAFKQAKINENVRSQELSIEDWLKLIAALREYMV